MKQVKQIGRLASGGINHIPKHDPTPFIKEELQAPPIRSVQPIKLDVHERPQKMKKSKYQRE
jgi:hypothetical protein